MKKTAFLWNEMSSTTNVPKCSQGCRNPAKKNWASESPCHPCDIPLERRAYKPGDDTVEEARKIKSLRKTAGKDEDRGSVCAQSAPIHICDMRLMSSGTHGKDDAIAVSERLRKKNAKKFEFKNFFLIFSVENR